MQRISREEGLCATLIPDPAASSLAVAIAGGCSGWRHGWWIGEREVEVAAAGRNGALGFGQEGERLDEWIDGRMLSAVGWMN